VAVIDLDKLSLEDVRATSRCPSGAIVWLAGAQFAAAASPLPRSAVA
jgi:hypothetical protein